jgi:hypothetical protein
VKTSSKTAKVCTKFPTLVGLDADMAFTLSAFPEINAKQFSFKSHSAAVEMKKFYKAVQKDFEGYFSVDDDCPL